MKGKELNERLSKIEEDILKLKLAWNPADRGVFKKGEWVYLQHTQTNYKVIAIYEENKTGWIGVKDCYSNGNDFSKENLFDAQAYTIRKATEADMLSVLVPYAESKGFKHGTGVTWISGSRISHCIDRVLWRILDNNLMNGIFWICNLEKNDWAEIVKEKTYTFRGFMPEFTEAEEKDKRIKQLEIELRAAKDAIEIHKMNAEGYKLIIKALRGFNP